jgi:hypothetical protein
MGVAPADVVVIVPVLGRPHRVQPLVDSVVAATCRCDILFVGTDGDDEQIAAVLAAVDANTSACRIGLQTLPPNRYGDYAKKINLGYQITDNPFLFIGADDLHFHDGWLQAALAVMALDGIGVVGTQDLANKRVLAGDHATHCLVARAYVDEHGTIDEHGKVLHEGYAHEFVDDEFVGTAKFRGAFGFAADSVVEHLHPSVGKAAWDDLYRDEPRRMQQGRLLHYRRKGLWTAR